MQDTKRFKGGRRIGAANSAVALAAMHVMLLTDAMGLSCKAIR